MMHWLNPITKFTQTLLHHEEEFNTYWELTEIAEIARNTQNYKKIQEYTKLAENARIAEFQEMQKKLKLQELQLFEEYTMIIYKKKSYKTVVLYTLL